MRGFWLGLALLLAAGGCDRVARLGEAVSAPFAGNGLRGAPVEVDGIRFRTRIGTGPDRRTFVATTRGAARAPAAAVEAGRVRAVEHCIGAFGGSDIVWAVGPDAGAAAVDGNGATVLSGRCVSR
jgi:hypothetical protein